MAIERKITGGEAAKQAKMGRPKAEIDMSLLEELCKIQCTQGEIASCLGVSLATLKNRMNDDDEFLATYIKGRDQGRMSIRRKQYSVADAGNVTMLIWLGKQYLEQKDQSKTQLEHSGEINNVVASCSDDELNKRLGAIESAIKDKATE